MLSVRMLVICMVLLWAAGCTTVQPWERGNLAKPEMAWVTDSLEEQLNQHIYFAKEASSGGYGAAGGGCGCN